MILRRIISNAFQRLEACFLRSPVESNYSQQKYWTKKDHSVQCCVVVKQINCLGKIQSTNSNHKRKPNNKKGFFYWILGIFCASVKLIFKLDNES